MDKREHTQSSISLLKEETLNCSGSDPHFTLVLGYLLQLAESSLYLCEVDPFESKFYFQSTFQSLIITKNGSIDKVDYEKVLEGDLATKFKIIYKKMLGLWMEIQDDMMPHEAIRADLSNDQYKKRLIQIKDSISELTHLIH